MSLDDHCWFDVSLILFANREHSENAECIRSSIDSPGNENLRSSKVLSNILCSRSTFFFDDLNLKFFFRREDKSSTRRLWLKNHFSNALFLSDRKIHRPPQAKVGLLLYHQRWSHAWFCFIYTHIFKVISGEGLSHLGAVKTRTFYLGRYSRFELRTRMTCDGALNTTQEIEKMWRHLSCMKSWGLLQFLTL